MLAAVSNVTANQNTAMMTHRLWARSLSVHAHPAAQGHGHVQVVRLNAIHATDGAHDSHDAARPPLVLLHGLLGSSTNFRSLLPKLSLQAKRKVWAVDLRNHGQSPHSEVMSYDAMCADLDHFFHDHGLKKVVLLGHSLGGKASACSQ